MLRMFVEISVDSWKQLKTLSDIFKTEINQGLHKNSNKSQSGVIRLMKWNGAGKQANLFN